MIEKRSHRNDDIINLKKSELSRRNGTPWDAMCLTSFEGFKPRLCPLI
jgi:hypothetical protein